MAWDRFARAGVATGYGLHGRGVGVRVPVGSRIFPSPRRPDRLWGLPSLLYSGYRGLFARGVKRPGREPDRSPPASAEVKKMWIYYIFSHIRFHDVVFNQLSTRTTLPVPYLGKMCKERPWPTFTYDASFVCTDCENTTEIVSQDRRCPHRNSNHTPYEYKSDTWTASVV
jgi:hypothetical protein